MVHQQRGTEGAALLICSECQTNSDTGGVLGGSCYLCSCDVRMCRGFVETVNACLGGKLRHLEACTFTLILVLEGAGAESSKVQRQGDLFLWGQLLLLEHGDH